MKLLRRGLVVAASIIFIITCFATVTEKPAESDHRAWVHGVNWINIGNEDFLIFSSNGYEPTEPEDEWMHNVYYSWFNTDDTSNTFHPKVLVDADFAQEPASAAINSNGYLLVTCEDAQYDQEALDQTYGIFDVKLKEVINYGQKLMPPQGGHSGHTAASGEDFLVTFCDGWVSGGGVDNLGTGDDIYCRIVHEDGNMGELIETEVDEKSRDWWPVVAGSDTEWLQVWQKYGKAGAGGGKVWGAITSKSGTIMKRFQITDNNKYYYYDVCYIKALDRYLVTGSRMDGGFAFLIDKEGNVLAGETGLPDTVREARTIVNEFDDYAVAVYPMNPSGAAVLRLTDKSISFQKSVKGNVEWDCMGTDGTFTSDSDVLFATGTRYGVGFVKLNID